MFDAKAAIKLLEEERVELAEQIKTLNENATLMTPETEALIRKAEEERELALLEKRKTAEEKINVE